MQKSSGSTLSTVLIPRIVDLETPSTDGDHRFNGLIRPKKLAMPAEARFLAFWRANISSTRNRHSGPLALPQRQKGR